MNKAWLGFGAATWMMALMGCNAEVLGGGSGTGGSGGAGGGVSTTSAQSSGPSGQGGAGQGGAGGARPLGTCEYAPGGESGATNGAGGSCGLNFQCDGGLAAAECDNLGDSATCDCYLDGAFEGTCESAELVCQFPESCCFDLLGGPNPGPYGDCRSDMATGNTGGGTECWQYFNCDQDEDFEISIACTPNEDGTATCECLDRNFAAIGTCEDSVATCDYQGSCCHAIFNP